MSASKVLKKKKEKKRKRKKKTRQKQNKTKEPATTKKIYRSPFVHHVRKT